MKPKTEELLCVLLWTCDRLARPTFRNLTGSFEGWAYNNGLKRQLDVLERLQLIEKNSREPDARIYRLSTQGRIHALGGRDPAAEWARTWDGLWRMVLFDVPLGLERRRKELRRYLQHRALGCLQRSVWVTPHALELENELLRGEEVDAGALTLLEGRPCGGESDADLVLAAWDFEDINGGYRSYIEVLDQHPTGPITNQADAKALHRWSKLEQESWLQAVSRDPLLPQELLPANYQGIKAWNHRQSTHAKAAQQVQSCSF